MSETLSNSDFNSIIVNLVKENGLNSSVKHNYNIFMQSGIRQILTQVFNIDRNVKQTFPDGFDVVNVCVSFNNVRPCKPSKRTDSSVKLVFPQEAKKGMFTYSSAIYCNIKIELKGYKDGMTEPYTREETFTDQLIAELPIPTDTIFCNIHGMTKSELLAKNEDPTDSFGYFIVNGGQWVVLPLETKPFNFPSIYRNEEQTTDEKCRLEIISKPGDGYENSCQMIIIYKKKGGIILQVPSFKDIRIIEFPFFIFMRLFGAMTDEEIFGLILGCSKFDNLDDQQKSMYTILSQAVGITNEFFPDAQNYKDNIQLRDLVYDCLSRQELTTLQEGVKLGDVKAKYIQTFMDALDSVSFPHIGIGNYARRDKLKYIARLIRYTLLVYLGEIPSSDRDDFANKRSKLAGESMGSLMKNILNKTGIKSIVDKINNIIPTADIRKMILRNLITGINASEFASKISKAINSGDDYIKLGNDTTNKNFRTNRVELKNMINNTVASNSMTTRNVIRGGTRSHEMRHLHESHPGNSCLFQSPDTGNKVGLPKLKPPASFVSETDNSERLKDILLNDLLVTSAKIKNHTLIYTTTLVLVNGYQLGYVDEPAKLVTKYREMRRGWDINSLSRINPDDKNAIGKHTGIYWDINRNEINFWVDSGRILQPLLVVRNNSEFDVIGRHLLKTIYDNKSFDGFEQDIMINKSILDLVAKKKIKVKDLIDQGIIDLIGPDELFYSHICESIETLNENRNNPLNRFDYYQIPTSRYGLPILHCPQANLDNSARIVFSGNQVKAANNLPSLAWPFDYTKKKYAVHMMMYPLVTTIANQMTPPIGYNCYIGTAAIATNQEDSIEFNKDAADLGAFATDQITTLSKKYSRNESPMQATTDNVGRNTRNFSKLDKNGFIKKYSKVTNGDVLICVGEFNKVSNKQDVDGSLIYENKIPAIITAVIERITEGNKKVKFVSKIGLVDENPIGEGDKFSSRHGQKGVVSCRVRKTDMFNTMDGIIPTLIISNHAHPTRMDPGQLVEQILSDYCLHKGKLFDATSHTHIDEDIILEYLETVLFNKYGHGKTFNPHTGLQCKNDFACQMITYYRLQKFAANECNISADKVHKSNITNQPVSGFRNGGGGKISELAILCIAAQGSAGFQYVKYRYDCDGVTLPICMSCGRDAIYNFKSGNSYCKHCIEQMIQSDIVNVPTANITKVIFQIIKCMGIDVQCF
jgi:DNA-directed RNA polymerase beta subunit